MGFAGKKRDLKWYWLGEKVVPALRGEKSDDWYGDSYDDKLVVVVEERERERERGDKRV